jgi:hypothetical protein
MTEYNNNNCIICYTNKCSITTTCGHKFCDKCLVKWIKLNTTCPNCRHSFDMQEQQDIIFYKKRVTRSTTFSYRKNNINETLKDMLHNFSLIINREEQIMEARKICNYLCDRICYYKQDKLLINTFINKINELEKDGVNECSIIRFKLRERNII